MPPSRDQLLKVCEILSEQEGLKVAISQSLQGACLAFVGALMGGLVGGPIGMGVGGAAGSTYAAIRSNGKFRSVVHVILYDMTPRQQHELSDSIMEVVRNVDASDAISLITLLNADSILKELVLGQIQSYLVNNMSLKLI